MIETHPERSRYAYQLAPRPDLEGNQGGALPWRTYHAARAIAFGLGYDESAEPDSPAASDLIAKAASEITIASLIHSAIIGGTVHEAMRRAETGAAFEDAEGWCRFGGVDPDAIRPYPERSHGREPGEAS